MNALNLPRELFDLLYNHLYTVGTNVVAYVRWIYPSTSTSEPMLPDEAGKPAEDSRQPLTGRKRRALLIAVSYPSEQQQAPSVDTPPPSTHKETSEEQLPNCWLDCISLRSLLHRKMI
jgi:hypothetical protein